MMFVKLKQHPHESYSCVDWSDENISLLGFFFASDLGCPGTFLDNWIFEEDQDLTTSGNTIKLKKEDNYIYLSNIYDEQQFPTRLKISPRSLFSLLYDWQNKVCKKNPQPQEIIIKYENNIFTLDTID